MRKGTNHSGIQAKSRIHDGRADGLLRTFSARTTASSQGSPDGSAEHSGHEPSGTANVAHHCPGRHPSTCCCCFAHSDPPPRWLPQKLDPFSGALHRVWGAHTDVHRIMLHRLSALLALHHAVVTMLHQMVPSRAQAFTKISTTFQWPLIEATMRAVSP